MADLTPTRSVALQLQDERRTMREGYAFLDEKCLLLAGQMLHELRAHQALVRELAPLQAAARAALQDAIARHGRDGLQVYPAAPGHYALHMQRRALLGVALLDATLAADAGQAEPAVWPSPEAEACRAAHARLAAQLVRIAATSTNLARLYAEYRRTVRRVRALQDVLLPEVEGALAAIESALEELEQDEFGAVRRAARGMPGA
jgi:V/A-type H+-transporting ATPase subunit D